MINSSAEFQKVVKASHKVLAKAEVRNAAGTVLEVLKVNDGNVRINSANKHRRTADVKLSDPTGSLTPDALTSLLHPLSGNEVYLYRGAYVPGVGEEYILLGVFPIKDTEIMDSGADLGITVKLIDRSLRLSNARNVQPLAIYPGAGVTSTIKLWAQLRYPSVQFKQDFDLIAPWYELNPGVIDRASDMLEVLTKFAKDIGYDLLFDNEGLMDLQPLPSGTPSAADVSWTVSEGETGTLLSIRKDLTQDDTYNHTVCYSQNTDGTAPVWAEAYESDPNHPLNIYGPIGDKPFFYSSGMFRTTEQCYAAASALLYKHLGHTEHIHFNNVVNPCVTDGDVAQITRAKSKIDNYYSLDNITIPLTAVRAMECDSRERFIT